MEIIYKLLFLDDIRSPIDVFNINHNNIYLLDWFVVRSVDEFKKFILKNNVNDLIISYDHDLGLESFENEQTGYDAAKWLVEYCLDNNVTLPSFLIHSQNPVGSKNIFALLNNFKKYQTS